MFERQLQQDHTRVPTERRNFNHVAIVCAAKLKFYYLLKR